MWQAPEVYYPRHGWEKLSGRWTPPEEVRVVRAARARRDAERALEAARAAAARADKAAEEGERALEQARVEVERFEAHAPAVEAARAAADAELRARAGPAPRRGLRARGAPALRPLGAPARVRRVGDAAPAPVERLLPATTVTSTGPAAPARPPSAACSRSRRTPRACPSAWPRRAAPCAGPRPRRPPPPTAPAPPARRTEAEDHRAEVEREQALARAARAAAQGR
ncbi:MAG: hypothetical protein M9894_35680 [Planctomycetes bacterium]|nr:hypothetical protein [Planctomycetota bacterium]